MATDLSVIHPELRPIFQSFPRIPFNRWNVRLFQWLTRLMPRPKIHGDIQIEQVAVQSSNANHSIRLRIYKPVAITSPSPVLFWIHGGGFIIGSVQMDDAYLILLAQELGIRIVSVDYRLAPDHPFPTPLDDCYCALKWTHDHAGQLGIDPGLIAVGGASAGGGLAATLVQFAHDRGEVHPVFQLLVYPMLDDRSTVRLNVPNKNLLTWTQENNRLGWESYLRQPCGMDETLPYAVAARRNDLAGLPPAWIGVGTLDLFYEEDVAYAKRLQVCGVDCELVIVPGAFHGFDGFDHTLPVVRAFRNSQMKALRKYLLRNP